MVNKTAVQFRKLRKTTYAFQRLKYCKSCGNYHILFETLCPKCRAQDSFVYVEQYARTLTKRLSHAEKLAVISFLLLGVVLASDLTQLSIAFGAGIALLIFYYFLITRYKSCFEAFRLKKLLDKQTSEIAQGIADGVRDAVEDLKHDQYKNAYEKLREAGIFLRNDRIKLRKIMCLNNFIIRKDMDLELESLIPSDFDKDFVAYLYEVSKVNRQLIRQSVLNYVTNYRKEIEQLENGKNILTNVIAASLRMKHFVLSYQSLIIDYVDLLPKERFHRLCKMISASPGYNWGKLAKKCKETTRIRYSFDPDFQGIW